jgi:hypothetical protein
MTREDEDRIDKLTSAIGEYRIVQERQNAKQDAFNEAQIEHIRHLRADVGSVRQAQQQHGTAIENVQVTLRHHINDNERQFVELGARAKRHSNEVREISMATAQNQLERAASRAAWSRVGRAVWRIGWKVLLALAALGVFGGGAAVIFNAVK